MLNTTEDYKEYLNEIPLNTVKHWANLVSEEAKWSFAGWTGYGKEPYRHWCAFPNLEDHIKEIWDCINESFKEDGFNLIPHKVIANLFNHGDSSWLHVDNEDPNNWTAILYMNDYWDLNWGGETVIVKNNEIYKAFAPTPGKFILFKSNLLHGPRPVTREAPYPRFGLTFQCINDSNR